MPTIKFKSKSTGKTYDMPWEKETPPTTMDLADYVDSIEHPTISQRASKLWEKINKPLTDAPSRMGAAFEDWVTTPSKDPDYWATTKGFIGGAAKGLGDVASSLTSPLSLGLTAATAGAGTAGKLGLSGTAQALKTAGRLGSAGIIGHGAYQTGTGLYEGDIEKAAGGTLEMAGGALGYHQLGKPTIPPMPTEQYGPHLPPSPGPNVRYGVPPSRRLPPASPPVGTPTMRELPPAPFEEGSFSEINRPQSPWPRPPQPPEPQGLPPVSNLGLPPARDVYYGGPTGPVSTNIHEPPTRTFQGGPGLTPPDRPAPGGWSAAVGRIRDMMKGSPELQQVRTGPNIDPIEQTSPYGRMFSRAGEPPVVPMGEIPPVTPEITPPVKPATPAIPDVVAPEPTVPKVKKAKITKRAGVPVEEPKTPANPFEGQSDENVMAFARRGNESALAEMERRLSSRAPKPLAETPLVETPEVGPVEPSKLKEISDPTPGETLGQYQKRAGITFKEAERRLKDFKAQTEVPAPREEFKAPGPRPYGEMSDKELRPLIKARDPEAILEGTRRPTIQKEMGGFLKKAAKKREGIKPFDTEAAGRERTTIENDWRGEMLEEGYKVDQVDAAIEKARKHKIDLSKVEDLFDLEERVNTLSGKAEVVKKKGKLGKIFSKLSQETGAVGPDLGPLAERQAAEKAARKVAKKGDAFERGELDSTDYTDPFTHEGFLADLRKSVKKGAKRLAKEEKGEITIPNVLKEDPDVQAAKDAANQWIRKRRAAVQWAKQAGDRSEGGKAAAWDEVSKAWQELKDAGHKPLKVSGHAPEDVAKYVLESKMKLANKEFKGWLADNGYLKGGKIDTSTPIGKKLAKWRRNHLTAPEDWARGLGDWGTRTKNIYLSGGVPGTPINIHGANIAKADIKARGLKGAKSALEGVFRPSKDLAVLEKHKALIPEAMEHGFTWGDIGEAKTSSGTKLPASVHRAAGKVPGGKYLAKGAEKYLHSVEDPLFNRYLPARKLEFLAEKVTELEKSGLSRGDALKNASSMANDFYGGVEKNLRSRTGQELMKFVAVAPDWFESRMRLGGKELMSGAKTLAGKGTAADKTYAKSLARGLVMRMAREATLLATGKSVYDAYTEGKASSSTEIPAGETSVGRQRSIPTTASSELLNIGEEGLNKAIKNEDYLDTVKNRMSQPLRGALNAAMNVDEFGNPLRGKSKFGKDIGFIEGTGNTVGQLLKQFQPQLMQSGLDYAQGHIDAEELLAKGLELPIQYRSGSDFGRVRRGKARGLRRPGSR